MIPGLIETAVTRLQSEGGLAGVTVRGGVAAAGDTAPFLIVDAPYTGVATHPAPEWWNGIIQVNCVHNTDLEAHDLADTVIESLTGLAGTVNEAAVIADAVPTSLMPIRPSGFAPALGHWLVSVNVTARNPHITEGS